ncbi:MAG: hypothetical protein ACYSWO_19835 [Planctomycetota bacterium]
MSKKVVRIHPAIAEEFRKVSTKLDGIVDENRRLSAELQDEKRARAALERQEVHIDDMPGKQLPFKFQINIPFDGGSSSPVTGTVNVSRDGPFICRRIQASVLITDAPTLEFDASTLDYSFFIGRYVPITSRDTYTSWNFPASILATTRAVPPPFDFEWEYNDSGSERNRQDKSISGDVFNRQDDDGYLMNNEIFAAGTTINFIASPTRAVSIISETVGAETLTGAIDIELQITFDGFKVLQPLEM